MQITYLNCEKLALFIHLVTAYEYIYLFFGLGYVINAMVHKTRI